MVPNAFIGKSEPPAGEDLAATLGALAKALWDELLDDLVREYNLVTQEWNSYSRKAGWSLRLKRDKRNIVYLSPQRGSFLVSFALGDKAVHAALQSNLPAPVIELIRAAKRYAEGTAVRVQVHGPADLAAIITLTGIKLEN